MQAWLDEQHQAVAKKLDANSVVLEELSGWKPKVQAEVEQLQSNMHDLCAKVDQIAAKQEAVANSAYKVFDLTGSSSHFTGGRQ
jgi:outer membrane murein-binding lipoprotein Lpp